MMMMLMMVVVVSIMMMIILQATKLFCDIGYQGVVVFVSKILYREIQRLIQHCLLSKMVYFDVKYIIATRNYQYFNTGTVSYCIRL